MKDIQPWICTDPSTLQFCRKIDTTVYAFRQFNVVYIQTFDELKTYPVDSIPRSPAWDQDQYWYEDIIDISYFDNSDINHYISSYGYNMESIKEMYPIEWEQIIAECIFETNMIY